MICSKCDTEIPNGGKFCPKCGEPVPVVSGEIKTSSSEKRQERNLDTSQNKQNGMKYLLSKHSKLIFAALAVVVVAVLFVIFKYMALIPIIILLVLFAVIMINRRILRKIKGKDSQEIAQCALADNEINKLAQYFVNRDEKYISSLGNGYIMNYLASGSLSRGFAVISNKRVYFRGSCFSGQGKSLVKTDEERTVDIKDVTGSGFIYRRYIGVLLGLFVAFVALIGGICGSTLFLSYGWNNLKKYQKDTNDLHNIIERINTSDKLISNINKQITENQSSIDELQVELSELTSLQTQRISEEALKDLSISDFLYDTEINAAFNKYLYEMDDLFRQSELFTLLHDLRDAAFDVKYGNYTNDCKARATAIINETDPLSDYYLDGNILIDYYTENPYLSMNLVDFCTYFTGVSYSTIQQAYAVFDYYAENGWYARDQYYATSIAYGWADDNIESIHPYTRISPEEQALAASAYQNFIAEVAPTYLDSETEFTLEDIVLTYLELHPNASFSSQVNTFGITTEYDSEVNELNTQIANLNDSNSKLKNELTELQDLTKKSSSYELRYNNARKDVTSAFYVTSLLTITIGLLITFLISCFLVFLDYLKKRKTMFQIQYAGGCIAFNVSYYAKAEIDDFQKQLRRAKDFAEESTAKATASESPVQPSTQSSMPDDLRKYADLLKEGLISQEEYDAMKKKILNL